MGSRHGLVKVISLQLLSSLTPLAFALAVEISSGGTVANAMTFNFTAAPGTSAYAINGFKVAGDLWSSQLNDNVTVNINIDYRDLGSGILGQTSSTQGLTSYTYIHNVLSADITSANDALAVSNLQSPPALNLLLNYTSNNPNGYGSSTPYLDNDRDANNTTIRLTSTNAKALGLFNPTNPDPDASIAFNSSFSFDFDRSDGISIQAYDFIGVAAHEIGHALGFNSGVDVLDSNSPRPQDNTFFPDETFTYVSPLDLFCYSKDSVLLAPGVLDWTASPRNKYFSIDGGTTQLVSFATGEYNGDADLRQASHWKDNLGLGIMDPTATPGELLQISNNDSRVFDVIGYDRATAVPFEFSPGLGISALAAWGIVSQFKRQLKKRKL